MIFFSAQTVIGQQFSVRQVLSNKLELLVPVDFKLMDISMLRKKYPIEGNRPDEVYTNNTASVNIAFNHTEKSMSENDIKTHAGELIALLSGRSGVRIISDSQERINGKYYLIIDFYSAALNASVYNKMFITVLEGKMLIGTFNCIVEMEASWKEKAVKIIHSINVSQRWSTSFLVDECGLTLLLYPGMREQLVDF